MEGTDAIFKVPGALPVPGPEPAGAPRKGTIFNIQHFSIQDGPGIRTTLFLKGCPLHCPWCSNPESLFPARQVKIAPEKCRRCEACVGVCETGALSMNHEGIMLDHSLCSHCMRCLDACRYGGITGIGTSVSSDDVVRVLLKDRIFYDRTRGGVTISGGEPLCQHDFLSSVLKCLHSQGVHTALDTTGYAPWPVLGKVLEHVNLLLYDIKHLNSRKHRETLGVDIEPILDNLRRCSGRTEIWLRTPLIPGFNDDFTFTDSVVGLAGSIGASKCFFLPFHRWGEHKYGRLGMTDPYGRFRDFGPGELDAFRKRYRSRPDFVFFEKD